MRFGEITSRKSPKCSEVVGEIPFSSISSIVFSIISLLNIAAKTGEYIDKRTEFTGNRRPFTNKVRSNGTLNKILLLDFCNYHKMFSANPICKVLSFVRRCFRIRIIMPTVFTGAGAII